MKVAVISTQILPVPPKGYGGLERQAYYQAIALHNLGHDVTVFAPRGSMSKGWKIYETGDIDPSNNELKAYKQYKEALKDFDLIIDNSWLKASMMDYDNVLGITHGANAYSSYPPHGQIVAVSNSQALDLMEQFGRPIPFIYNAVEGPFRDSGKHEDYLLYLSRFSVYKGPLAFINYCKTHNKKGIMAGTTTLIENDPMTLNVLNTVKEIAKNDPLIDFRGEVDDKERAELLEHAAMLVSPLMNPYKEVFGMNLVEAMSYGTIPYATQKGATEEVIGEGGWTVANWFVMVNSPLPPRTDELRQKAVNRAKSLFSIEALQNTLKMVLEKYEKAMEKNKRGSGMADVFSVHNSTKEVLKIETGPQK